MANIGAFNPQTVEPQKPLEPLPTGWYFVQIVESEVKPTKANDGHYLELVLEVIDGEYRGRKAWDRLNLHNANPTAVEIANRTLSAICHATNTLHQISDSAELHGKPLMARIVKRAASAEYDESNDVRGYKKIEGGAATAPVAPWASGGPASAPPQMQPMQPPVAPPSITHSPQPQYPPEAIAWARANAADPRAQAILAALGPPAPPAWTPPPAPPPPPAAPAWQPPTPQQTQPPAAATPPWQRGPGGNGTPATQPVATGWAPPPAPPAASASNQGAAKPPWEK